ncbi:hypothetical protein [Flammeovirga sp. EKP202]|uniref:hypothetical protein n=1 Tax=Flammeovirga sp. EKP202 TaxID=2770592 RepID=UPI00165FC6CC|nr:hypothetical protein [Flammeovirga sp. EKP202]MBD0405013.1 hypothetical protein [Flammeovirga sp. EKP202]
MEEEFDLIKGVWEEGHQTSPDLKSVKETAKNHKKESMNLINKIVNKTKLEWVITWAVILCVALYYGITSNNWLVVGLGVLPVAVYFLDYLLKLKKVRSFDSLDTLNYLKNVKAYILKSYQQQIKMLIYGLLPYSMLFGYFFGVSLGLEAEGDDISRLFVWDTLTQLVSVFSIIALSIIFLLFRKFTPPAMNYWIDKFYGKDLKGIDEMIEDLER